MVSINALRRSNPGKEVVKTAASLGLRIGVDRIPRSMLGKKQVIVPIAVKKGPVEPHWHRATTPQPPLELKDIRFDKTPIGTFLHREWARHKKSVANEEHKYNGLPKGTIRNPFLPWFNPITRTYASPIYSSLQQHVLQKECRRLGWTDILPSGKKTPDGFANSSITAFAMKGPDGAKERVDLGTITWHGVHVPKLNPFGAGRFLPGALTAEQLAERKIPGTDLDRWGPYIGRKLMFKGTKAERNKPKREQEIATRMKGMKKRIEAWKQERAAIKIKERPALPF